MNDAREDPVASPRQRPVVGIVRSHDFLRDILVTTLGVLIALALGALATAVGWSLDVRAAKASLFDELGEAADQARTRVYTNGCVEARFDAIARIIDEAAQTGRLPPTGNFYGGNWFTWDDQVWQGTLTSGTAAHMSIADQSGYGGTYGFVAHLNDSNNQELRDWAPLYTIAGPGRPVTSDELARLRTALAQARMTSRLVNLQSVRLLQMLDAWDIAYDRSMLRSRAEVLQNSRSCQPISRWTDDQAEGGGPLAGALQRAIENPLTADTR